jgi:hypothetical protein
MKQLSLYALFLCTTLSINTANDLPELLVQYKTVRQTGVEQGTVS